MSPLIGGRAQNPDLGGDDEVERRDRGEELVRQRMKDRARVKKVCFLALLLLMHPSRLLITFSYIRHPGGRKGDQEARG